MSNDYLVLKPTTRTAVTTVEPNNYASPLLDDRVFRDGVTDINLTLSATDIIDTLSATAQTIVSLNFNINDIIDTSETNIEVIVSQLLNVTDSKDTIESSAENIVSAEFDTTDNIDISDITAQLDRILILEATELTDTAVIRANGGAEKKRNNHLAVWSFLKRLRKPLNAKLKVSEAQDTIKVQAELDYTAQVRISEQRDRVVFLTKNDILSVVVMSEKADATIIDEAEFKIKSDKIYSDYEAHEMAIFAMAS